MWQRFKFPAARQANKEMQKHNVAKQNRLSTSFRKGLLFINIQIEVA